MAKCAFAIFHVRRRDESKNCRVGLIFTKTAWFVVSSHITCHICNYLAMLRALRTRLRLRQAFSPRCLSSSTEGVPHTATPAHENASQFPDQADVVVIGGGSIGNSTLYHLGKLGVNAVLLEKDQLTAGKYSHSDILNVFGNSSAIS